MRIIKTAIITAIITAAISSNAFASTAAQRVARVVQHSFTQQLRSRESLGGYRVLSTTMKCAPAYNGTIGGYVCRGGLTVSGHGATATYACIIDAGSDGYTWHETGQPWLVRQW